jgi:hypothetical protein
MVILGKIMKMQKWGYLVAVLMSRSTFIYSEPKFRTAADLPKSYFVVPYKSTTDAMSEISSYFNTLMQQNNIFTAKRVIAFDSIASGPSRLDAYIEKNNSFLGISDKDVAKAWREVKNAYAPLINMLKISYAFPEEVYQLKFGENFDKNKRILETIKLDLTVVGVTLDTIKNRKFPPVLPAKIKLIQVIEFYISWVRDLVDKAIMDLKQL